MHVFVLILALAQAQPAPTAPPIVEATTSAQIETPVKVLKDPVLNPFLPERRFTWGLGIAGQLVCPLVYLAGRGAMSCFVGPRVSLDFYIGKMTFDFMIGASLALGLGLEMGSPFVQLGGATSPFSLAVRGVVRVRLHTGIWTFRPTRLGGGLGVTLSWAIAHRVSLQVQLAPEINALTTEESTPGLLPVRGQSTISLDLNTWLGLRFAL